MEWRLLDDELGTRPHVARERVGRGVAHLRGKLDGGRAVKRIKYMMLKLLQSLVCQNQADVELARLVENDRDLRVPPDEILALIDVDETWEPLVLR